MGAEQTSVSARYFPPWRRCQAHPAGRTADQEGRPSHTRSNRPSAVCGPMPSRTPSRLAGPGVLRRPLRRRRQRPRAEAVNVGNSVSELVQRLCATSLAEPVCAKEDLLWPQHRAEVGRASEASRQPVRNRLAHLSPQVSTPEPSQKLIDGEGEMVGSVPRLPAEPPWFYRSAASQDGCASLIEPASAYQAIQTLKAGPVG